MCSYIPVLAFGGNAKLLDLPLYGRKRFGSSCEINELHRAGSHIRFRLPKRGTECT